MAIPQSTLGNQSHIITLQAIGVKLNGNNYVVWKARLLPLLRANKLLPIVEGTSSCPPTHITQTSADGTTTIVSNPTYEDWSTHDQVALKWILNTLADTIVGRLSTFTSSTDAWRFTATSYVAQNHV